jgi:hypothetical protein
MHVGKPSDTVALGSRASGETATIKLLSVPILILYRFATIGHGPQRKSDQKTGVVVLSQTHGISADVSSR